MIVQSVANSFKLSLLSALASDVFRLALYTDAADLDETTPGYTPNGEVRGPGYMPGGVALAGTRVMMDGSVALMDWDDPVWANASITARAGLVYNASRGNSAVGIIDLQQNYTSTNGAFMVSLPAPTAATALIRVS